MPGWIEILLVLAGLLACAVAIGAAIAARARADILERVIERQEKYVDWLDDQLASLIKEMVHMKQAGFQAGSPRSVEVLEPLEPLPRVVERALQAVNEPGLEEMARGWLAGEAKPEEVASRILAGGTIPG